MMYFLIVNLVLDKDHSTTHALIDLQDKIPLAIENNNFCIGTYL